MALVAAASMALEIVAARLIAPWVGMSLYSWTAIITVVLAGLSLGHMAGGWLADRPRGRSVPAGAALMLAGATTLASLFVIRTVAPATLGALDPIAGIGALATAAFFLPSLFAGILSPLLTRMALDRTPPDHRGRVLGQMFALGAAGAILGTVASGFWLISFLGSHAAVGIIALAYALLGLPFLSGPARFGGGAVAAAILLAATVGPGRIEALTGWCDVESDYYCIRIDPVGGAGREARVMALDHLAHGVNDSEDPTLIHSPYVQLVDEMVRLRLGRLDSAFFLGGGAYTLPRAWAARFPEASLMVAEIDPAVTTAAVDDMWVEPERLDIRHGDGRVVLTRLPAERRFDVIFGDAFHDISIPAHLVTDEFHALVRKRLTPGGFYAINAVDGLTRPRFVAALARTLRARFEHVELWLDLDQLRGGGGRTTWVVVASDLPTGRDAIEAEAGFRRRWVRVPTEAVLEAAGAEGRIFLTDDLAPVDRLMRHILLDAALSE